eukprot:SAG25_NODE_1338_length_3267_cov_8.611111_4_plen_63_part_00
MALVYGILVLYTPMTYHASTHTTRTQINVSSGSELARHTAFCTLTAPDDPRIGCSRHRWHMQ